MTLFARKAALGGALVVFAFTSVLVYCAQTIPTSLSESKATLNQFFGASKRHQPQEALDTLTPQLRDQIGEARLRALWSEFEKANGPIQKWTPADSNVRGGGRVCLWPRSVDYLYRVYGTKGQGNRVFFVRVVPNGATWRIDRLNIMH